MDWLEQELQEALARKEPRTGFAERVNRAAGRRPSTMPRWVATAAAVLIAAGVPFAYREYQGRVAKGQVLAAMRITAVKLNHIQERVREVRP